MYAITEDGGKQYKVSEGDALLIERRDLADDQREIVFDKVLMLGERAVSPGGLRGFSQGSPCVTRCRPGGGRDDEGGHVKHAAGEGHAKTLDGSNQADQQDKSTDRSGAAGQDQAQNRQECVEQERLQNVRDDVVERFHE